MEVSMHSLTTDIVLKSLGQVGSTILAIILGSRLSRR